MKRKARIKRLLKLADHLESGKLYRDHFRFGHYHRETACGSSGCALGECPFLFNKWVFVGNFPVHRKYKDAFLAGDKEVTDSAKEFFGLKTREAKLLFYPDQPLGSLGREAGPKDVAANIRKFVNSLDG